MRRPFESELKARRYHAPFSFDRQQDYSADYGAPVHTGATGASLGWADSIGRPELTPFAEAPDLRRRVLGDPAPFREGSWTSHRGRGPRNLPQPQNDAQLCEALCERLLEDDSVDPSEVSIEVRDGEVTLQGTVRERYMKHRIEDIVDGFAGVKEIHNWIKLAPARTSVGEAPLR